MSLVAYPCSVVACGRPLRGGIGVVTKEDEYVTNALESDASPRVQKCLDRAEYCERAASILMSPNAIATSLQAARSWREMAEQYREQERARGTFPAAPRIGSS